MVTIADDLEADVSSPNKKIVVVMARIHPCDTASSYVMQGMMEFLASDHGIAKDLRKHVVFKLFPVMCPDGVYLGNSRCTLLGKLTCQLFVVKDMFPSWLMPSKVFT